MRDLQITSNTYNPGRVAQSVEQRIENPRVGSSILPPATRFRKDAIADLQNWWIRDSRAATNIVMLLNIAVLPVKSILN
jgi:hypothetical protein